MALQVHLDHAQKRVGDDQIGLFAINDDWLSSSMDCWFEPVTKTVILRPYQLQDAWYTTATGVYAKLGLSDFGLGAGWEVRQDQHWKGPWIARTDASTNAPAILATTVTKNSGWFVSYFSYGSGDRFVQVRLGWNSTGAQSTGVVVEIWSDGQADVYKGGALVGSGELGRAAGNSQAGSVQSVMLLPGRQRELLVLGVQSGFSVVFSDILDTDTNPTITDAGKFFVNVLSGATQFQASRLRFPTSGTLLSEQMEWLEAPVASEPLSPWSNDPWPGGTQNYRVYGHQAFVGTQSASLALRNASGAGAFVANGSNTLARLQLTLTTDNQNYTPFVYGGLVSYAGSVATTNSTEQTNITDHVVGTASLSVPNEADGVTFNMEIRDPAALTISALSTQVNRPVLLRFGTLPWFDGVGGQPTFVDSATAAGKRLAIEVFDRWNALETYTFRGPQPLDGVNFRTALLYLAERGGWNATECQVSTTSFNLPDGTPSGGFSVVIEPGDTAADWVHKLIDTYAPDWIYGVRPHPTTGAAQFYALSPADIGTTPDATIYATIADAISIGGWMAAAAPYHVYWEVQTSVLQPLANDVRVTGQDARTGRPLAAHKRDLASMDPTTVPSSRPANWLGRQQPYGLIDPDINSQVAVNEATKVIFDRYSALTHMVEWRSDFLTYLSSGVPLWRGALVRLHGLGTYRIESFDGSFYGEESFDFATRQFVYVGRRVAVEP